MATLTTTAVIRAHDQLTGPLQGMANKVKSIGAGLRSQVQRAQGLAPALSGGMAAYGLQSLVQATRESAQLTFDAQNALLASAMDDKALKTGGDQLERARKQAEQLRTEAMNLSRSMGMMPEVFQKAGTEAAKMGLNFDQSKSMMKAAGLVQMSDKDADAATMAKALGTYGIIYGSEKDPAKYDQQLNERASMLALAGAATRTSASKIEEGMRNLMGAHGAFGGAFEDGVAIVAMGSQLGQMEKETGTAFKSLTTRFLRMPAEGRAAMAAAGIDQNKFMDFSAVDPTRATNQLVGAFPQQLTKGARGNISKFLERAQREGRLKDPEIINQTLAMLEKQGLKFAGDADREQGTAKIGSIMHGAGGKFDPIGLLQEVNKAIDEGRAGPNIWAAIGEPKRLHQYAAFRTSMDDLIALRDKLKNDKGGFLNLMEQGFAPSDIGKISRLESNIRRFQMNLMRSEGIQTFVQGLGDIAEGFANLSPASQNAIGLGVVTAALAGPVMIASRALWAMGAASTAALVGLGRMAAIPFIAMASGLRGLSLGLGLVGMGSLGMAAAGLGGVAAVLGTIARVVFPVAAIGGLIALTGVDWDKLGKAMSGSSQWAAFKTGLSELSVSAADATKNLLGMFGIKVEGGLLEAGLKGLLSLATSLLDKIKAVFEAFNPGTPEQRAKNAGNVDAKPAAFPDAVAGQAPGTGWDNAWGATPGGPATVEMSSSSADSMGARLAEAFRAAVGNITISGSTPGSGGAAKAPANTTTNGQSRGGQ